MSSRILVVDDEPTLRCVISQVLAEDGHEVTEAASGEEALRAFRACPFPVVMTDIVMGKMSGLDLLQELKLLDSETVVVLMTSHATIEAATSALRKGAYDFLTKPFEDISQISAVVGRAVDKAKLVHEKTAMVEHLQRTTRELETLNEQLQEMAVRDGLTGLFNHRYFRDRLEQEIHRCLRHGHVFSLVFMDVDRFKHFNDTHGHLEGDNLLRVLASLIKEHSRTSTIAARYGGEEFVQLVPEADREAALACAENLRGLIEEHPFEGGQTQPGGKLTMSLGVATFPDDGTDANALLQAADEALYRAKEEGRNRVRAAGRTKGSPAGAAGAGHLGA